MIHRKYATPRETDKRWWCAHCAKYYNDRMAQTKGQAIYPTMFATGRLLNANQVNFRVDDRITVQISPMKGAG